MLSLHSYLVSKALDAKDLPFYALIASAMRKADTDNLARLRAAFPEVWSDLYRRYNAPGGILPEDGVDDPSSVPWEVSI